MEKQHSDATAEHAHEYDVNPHMTFNTTSVILRLQCFDAVGWACIRPAKNCVAGCWHGYLSGADLHMAQLMPLPLTISCSSKSRLV